MMVESLLEVVARHEHAGGIEMEGQSEALLRLAALLAEGDATTTDAFTIPCDRVAAPFDGFLTRLRLRAVRGPVRIRRDGETLCIEGSAEALGILAQNVEFLASSVVGPGDARDQDQHIHLEYYAHHPFLAPEAEPLTVVLLGPPAEGL